MIYLAEIFIIIIFICAEGMKKSVKKRHQPKVHFTRKRRREEEKEQEVIRQNAEFQTQLTDINDDCLETIFMYLDFDDFINIAHTNKLLKPAADTAFSRKFGWKWIDLDIKSKYRGIFKLQISDTIIKVHDFQTSLRLLRCFGHLISKLHVGPASTSRLKWTAVKLVGYANKYGFKSMVFMKFRNMPTGAFEDLTQPFLTTIHVFFGGCTMDGKLEQLSKWFPKLYGLELINVDTHLEYIEANMTTLVCLAIDDRRLNKGEQLVNALRLNPLLETLFLNTNGWVRILQNASVNRLSLDRVWIACYPGDFQGIEAHIFDFPNPIHLHMDFVGLINQPVPEIPVSFRRLQKFTWGSLRHRLDQSVMTFFEKHASIKNLNLMHFDKTNKLVQNNQDIVRIARALPLLEEVEFACIELTVGKVIPFMNQAKLLNKICFNMTDYAEFDRLKMLLNKEWHASFEGQRVELKRVIEQA